MPYTTVVAGTAITASWANANVRDQVVTPFASAAARTSAVASPVEGMISYLTDVNRFEFWNGAAWQPVSGVAAKVVRSGSQSFGAATTPVEWQTVVYDGFSMWSGGAPTLLTAPWPGFYAASATIQWASSDSGFYRVTNLLVNSVVEDVTSEQLDNSVDVNPLRQNVAANGLLLAAGDDLSVTVHQDSGSTRTIDTVSNFKLAYLGPAA